MEATAIEARYDAIEVGLARLSLVTQLRETLKAIADLDEAFENDSLDEADYTQQREQLKSELKALWS
jgi:DNA mismatch repair ATPase MutS